MRERYLSNDLKELKEVSIPQRGRGKDQWDNEEGKRETTVRDEV